MKDQPVYAIASVDHALRLSLWLQLEGSLTVAAAARRLGVARSTAHRLLQMLVYRDFAVQADDRSYRVGPVLALASSAGTDASKLRAAALPHLRRLVDVLDESASLIIRTGTTARFVASVECAQALRVTSREGMVFPAHRTTAGLLLLAELSDAELAALYDSERTGQTESLPSLPALKEDLAKIRRAGFALNNERSERGVVAIGVPVHDPSGALVAGLSVSMPSARYDKTHLPAVVAALTMAGRALEADLAA